MENGIGYMLSIRGENLHPFEFKKRVGVFIQLMHRTPDRCIEISHDEFPKDNEFRAQVKMNKKLTPRDLRDFSNYCGIAEVYCETIQ